jgi:hypothetical protein
VALLDTGTGPNPLIGGIHEPGDIVIGDDSFRNGFAGAENDGFQGRRVQGSGFRVQSSGFRVQGSGKR